MDRDLLGLIYDAALEPLLWQDAIAAIARQFDSEAGQILLWDEEAGGTVFSQMVGSGATDQETGDRLYAERYGAIDPRRQYALSLPVGEWMACHHVCDNRFVARSEFYQDFYIPVLDARYMCGTRLADEQGTHAMLAIARRAGPQARPFEHATLQALRQLTPHLSRAARLHMKIARLGDDLSNRETALDRLSFPMFLTEEDGRVRFMNRSGEELLQTAAGRLLVKAGCLAARDEDDQVRLSAAIRSAVVEAVGTSLLIGGSSGSPVSCTAIPLTDRGAFRTGLMARPAAMVLVGDQKPNGTFEQRMLEEIFRLTPAEARLASGVVAGTSIADYAQANRISINTVRAQLQAIFQKLGVNRQGALVAMLQRLLLPLRS